MRVTMSEISDNLLENPARAIDEFASMSVPRRLELMLQVRQRFSVHWMRKTYMNCLTLSATLFVFVFFCFPFESFLCQQVPATCLLFDLNCYHYTCHIWKASSFTLSQVIHLVGPGRVVQYMLSMTHKCIIVKIGGSQKKENRGNL